MADSAPRSLQSEGQSQDQHPCKDQEQKPDDAAKYKIQRMFITHGSILSKLAKAGGDHAVLLLLGYTYFTP
jgi:hypothetical protein